MLQKYIDTHAHYYDEAWTDLAEADDAIDKSQEAGVFKILQADISSHERDRMWEIGSRHEGVVYQMLGLYPGSVGADWEKEIGMLWDWMDKPFVAIGEIGLDYHFSTEFAGEQKLAFAEQLKIADKIGKPVNIHLRDATDAFFEVLDSCKGLNLRGNLHAFSGSWETFCRLQKYGDWSVGIGGVVTFKKASLAETVKKIPLESILLETDAPYLAPTPLRGTRNASWNIPLISAKIAELKGIDEETVAEVTTANARRLFGI